MQSHGGKACWAEGTQTSWNMEEARLAGVERGGGQINRKRGRSGNPGSGVTLSLVFEQNHSGACVENELNVSWEIHHSLEPVKSSRKPSIAFT